MVTAVHPEADLREFKPTLPAIARVIGWVIRPHLGLYALVLLLSVIEGLLGGLTIAALFPVFKSLVGVSVSGGGRILAWMQRVTSLLPAQPPIVAAGCLLLMLAFFKAVVALSRETLIGYASAQVSYYVRSSMFDRYIREGYQFFLDRRQGELIYNLYSGCLRVGNLFNQLPLVLVQVINIASLLVLLFSIHAKATAALMVLAASLHAGNSWMSRRVIYPIGKNKKDCMIDQQVLTSEFITGFKQILVFGTVPAWTKIHDEVNRRFRNLFTKEMALLAGPKNIWEFLAVAGAAIAMMWIGLTSPGSLSGHVATLGVYLVAFQRLLPFMSTLSRHWMVLYGLLPDAFVIYGALSAPMPVESRGSRVAPLLRDAIRFERVSFSYLDRGTLLSDVDVVFERGKVTAVVGASGAGKTTILNLILGLYEPTLGVIWIDGVDLRDIRLDSWLAQIGFVSQDPFIFNGTIWDNIAFFRRCLRGEIEEAARLANAHDFIIEFPDGYDTVVGDRGMKISGGQQQRVALARAILKRPDIFILDEATSSLDSLSETLIQDSLRKIAVDRTVIIVAHRLSTIIDADKILVLKDGSVAEEGTHAELLDARQDYCRLYQGDLPQTSS
jgi:ABC-type multidrug transport system fused ATPase/permease subunit